jgi:hypothetical protein
MKTKTYLSIGLSTMLVFLFANTSVAQNENKSRLGIKGGFNVTNLLDNSAGQGNMKLGINGGIFLRVAMNDLISFQPEFIYTMKGGTLDYNDLVTGSAKFSANYLEVPLLAVINITNNVNLQGGVYLSSLSNVRVRNKGNIGTYNFEDVLNKDDFNTFDYGLACGIGVDLDRLSAGLRYDFGLRGIGNKKSFGGQTVRFPDARNSAFQLYVGLSIL